MLLHKFKLLAIAGLLFVMSATAHAVDRGRWLCGDCALYQEVANVIASPEILNFIKDTVNRTVSVWGQGDTTSICDGIRCVDVVYRTGNWFYNGSSRSDPKSGYRNSTNRAQPSTSITGSSGTYAVYLQGHWEWWDYYSNGGYTGTDGWTYVVDSLQVTYFGSAGGGKDVNETSRVKNPEE